MKQPRYLRLPRLLRLTHGVFTNPVVLGIVAVAGFMVAVVALALQISNTPSPDSTEGVAIQPAQTPTETAEITLRRLAPGMSVREFDRVLGQAVQSTPGESATELIYINELYFLQAIVDSAGTVVFYSVTTRDPDFTPDIKLLTGGNSSPIEGNLGASTFSEVHSGGIPGGFSGAHNFGYYEYIWGANPGNYLTYFIAWNESGIRSDASNAGIGHLIEAESALWHHSAVPPPGKSYAIPMGPRGPVDGHSTAALRDLRTTMPVNTVGVGGPFLDFKVLQGFSVGPTYFRVRVLPR
jgi:hypothetical protein